MQDLFSLPRIQAIITIRSQIHIQKISLRTCIYKVTERSKALYYQVQIKEVNDYQQELFNNQKVQQINQQIEPMSNDLQKKMYNKMAYGAISRGQIPMDLEDYSVSLVKQHFKNSPPQLKLKFTSNQKNQTNSEFYIKIDDVREPANPMILIKYQEIDGKVIARPVEKIRRKLLLSVQKQASQHEDRIEISSSQDDSDIPKKPLHLKFFQSNEESDNEGRPRKRVKLAQEQKDQEQDS